VGDDLTLDEFVEAAVLNFCVPGKHGIMIKAEVNNWPVRDDLADEFVVTSFQKFVFW
jgi:hypothetical protein